jgi:hypothetical protein
MILPSNKQKFIFQREKFGIGNTLVLNALHNLSIKLREQRINSEELHPFATPTSGSMYYADFLTLHMYNSNTGAILNEITVTNNVTLRHLIKNGDCSVDGIKAGLLKLRKDLIQLSKTK